MLFLIFDNNSCILNTNSLPIIAIQESVDIEELVDDFVTYYIAGKVIANM